MYLDEYFQEVIQTEDVPFILNTSNSLMKGIVSLQENEFRYFDLIILCDEDFNILLY